MLKHINQDSSDKLDTIIVNIELKSLFPSLLEYKFLKNRDCTFTGLSQN